MEKLEQQRTQDRLMIRMSREAFSPKVMEALRARQDTAGLLLPEAEENGDEVQLCFSLSGMESLNEASAHLGNEALLNAVKQLTEAVLDLPNYGLDITQVLTATDQVMLGKDGIRLLCLCSRERAQDRAGARKALVQQIRQLIVSREGMDELVGFLANPYCSLEAIRGRLQKMQETAPVSAAPAANRTDPEPPPKEPESTPSVPEHPEDKKPSQPETAEKNSPAAAPVIPLPADVDPGEKTPSVSRPFKPEFFTQMNAGSAEPAGRDPRTGTSDLGRETPMRTENPLQPFVPMGDGAGGSGAGMPFVSMDPAPVNPRAEAVNTPDEKQDSGSRPAVLTAGARRGGFDEATVYDEPPARQMPKTAAGMDEPTVDDGNGRTRSVRAGGLDEPTVDDSGHPLPSGNNGGKNRRSANRETDHDSGTGSSREEEAPKQRKKEKPEKPAPAPRPKTVTDPKKAFWESVTKLAVYIAAAVVLAILAGAFLGGAGIAVIVLAAAVGLAFLFSRGYLMLKWPKKPEAAIVPPTAPNVEEVFTVRLRMISQNLATHQEVIIRENNQIIGSDPAVCRSPVSYRGISRKHCRISCKRTGGHEEYFITDLGSTNGTKLNGERLVPNQDYPLKLGDHVTLAGKYDFKISSDAY